MYICMYYICCMLHIILYIWFYATSILQCNPMPVQKHLCPSAAVEPTLKDTEELTEEAWLFEAEETEVATTVTTQ